MTDIVDKLNRVRWQLDQSVAHEARDSITTLRAEVERLTKALKKIDLLNTPLHGWSMSDLIDQEIVASGIRTTRAQEPGK